MSGIAFTIFGVSVYWYSLFIVCGVTAGIFISVKLSSMRGYTSDMILDLLLFGLPLGVIGARLYFVAFEWDYYGQHLNEIFSLQMQGLAIYGAVIGGILAAFIVSKWRKISIFDILDAAVPSLILAQAIGRWGNFMNQEVYGAVIENIGGQVSSHLALLPPAVYIDALGEWHSALFFYESVWNLITFGILVLFFVKKKTYRGCTTWLYFAMYCGARAVLEGLRLPEYILTFAGLPVSQIVSGIMCLIAIALFIITYKKGGYPGKTLPDVYDASLKRSKKSNGAGDQR